ncbi:uncharacterized protein LOC135310374 [Phalacrocorax carbo]|uniref:uncharacterized protein LOC135310374 n=1 Tax=Phalacrocorax carbo TaxID=9209 RepID=UPI00311A64C5
MATDGAEAAGRGRLRGEPGGAPPPHPPLEATGSDVTHQPNPLAPPTRVDPQSGLLCRCLPGGPPPEPRSDWAPPQDPPRRGDPGGNRGAPRPPPNACGSSTP